MAPHPGDQDVPRFDVERRGDRWVVVTAGNEVVSEHVVEASAVAERQRLLESTRDGDATPDPQRGAYPDNVGG